MPVTCEDEGASQASRNNTPSLGIVPPGGLTPNSPGQTERVRRVLSRVKVDGQNRCPECSFHPPTQGHDESCPERTTA